MTTTGGGGGDDRNHDDNSNGRRWRIDNCTATMAVVTVTGAADAAVNLLALYLLHTYYVL